MEKKDPNIFADLELCSQEGYPSLYSLKLNGQEVGQWVRSLNLHLDAGGFPVLTLQVNAEKISINCRCIWEIPEPYAGLLEEKKLTSLDTMACERSAQSDNGSKLD